MKRGNKTKILFVTMFLSMVFFLPKANAEIKTIEQLNKQSFSNFANTTNHQGFKIPESFSGGKLISVYLIAYDDNETFDFCISETVDTDDNADDCITGTYLNDVSTENYNNHAPIKLDINWENYFTDYQYYIKFFDTNSSYPRFGVVWSDVYADGKFYYDGTEVTEGDLFFIMNFEIPEYCLPADCGGDSGEDPFDFDNCEIPENNNLIQRISGCENIHTTSTNTPSEIRTFYYDIPFFLLVLFLVFCISPILIVAVYIFMKKK